MTTPVLDILTQISELVDTLSPEQEPRLTISMQAFGKLLTEIVDPQLLERERPVNLYGQKISIGRLIVSKGGDHFVKD